jgi:NADPH:quinone reductase-like Zn-dependent oxidoreductase
MNETMLAAIVREHGDVNRVRVEEVPRPVVSQPDEVLVRVRACALNRLDIFARRGLTGPGLRPRRLPFISGVDIAGEIADVGAAATEWQEGDRVVVYPGVSCANCDHCRRGEETMCANYRIIGEHMDGGLGQYCLVPAANLERLPEHIPFATAAAIPVAYTTAWRMIVPVGKLFPHERVLVLGASGGVGTAAIHIARRIGAVVLAVTSSPEKAAQLKAIGANCTIDRTTDDLEEAIQHLTNRQGVDMIINPVGGNTWRAAIRSLTTGGRMLLCGATAGDSPPISIREIYQAHRQILGAPLGNRSDFRAILDLVFRREITPTIDRILPLEQVSEAHALLEENALVGKVVMTIG